jgi:hypothetical protein
MTPKTDSGSFAPDATTSSPSGSKRQFDTFETDFFQQGDDASAGIAVAIERFDDLDDSSLRKKLTPSRQFMMGVAVGSTCIAIIGCLALWRSSGAKSHPEAAVVVVPPAQADPAAVNPVPSAAPAQIAPAAVPAPVQAEPTQANPAAVAAPTQAEPVPLPAPSQPAPAVAEEQVVPAPSPAAVAAPIPSPAAAAPVLEKPSPAVAASAEAKPAAVQEKLEKEDMPLPVAAPAAAASADDAQGRCKKAIGDKRNKEILAACPEAFAADSSAADIAVTLAKIEFDRGRGAQASAWGQKGPRRGSQCRRRLRLHRRGRAERRAPQGRQGSLQALLAARPRWPLRRRSARHRGIALGVATTARGRDRTPAIATQSRRRRSRT